jgi:hypothetical protein
MVARTSSSDLAKVGLKEGFRSGLEDKVAVQLRAAGFDPHYEEDVIPYTKPERIHKYHPDFRLRDGLYIETKGRFVTADRQKHILIKAQHPDIEIRFVFSNSKARISKSSKTTYADWCIKHGFLYADKLIPKDWLS